MRARHAVTHRVWEKDGEDAYGNEVPLFREVARRVFAWWVPGTDEPPVAGHQRVTADVSVLAPAFPVADRDQFVIPAFSPRPLRVEGLPQSWDHGPFNYRPGQQIDLRFVEG